MERDPQDTARLDDIEDREEVERLDDNRVVIRTGPRGDGSSVTLTVSLDTPEDGVETETFEAESTYAAFTKFVFWYAAETDDDRIRRMLRDV